MNRLGTAVLVAGAAALLAGARPAGAETAALDPDEAVIGVSLRNTHRAYPLSAFAQRRVVNDLVGSLEIAVFHDPERRLATAWFRTVLGEPIEFSGLAAGTVADDLTTVTRWDLTSGRAVGGNLEGQRLVAVPVTTTTWKGWSELHPNAGVYREEQR